VSADGDHVTVEGFIEAPLLDTAPYFVEVFTGEGCGVGEAAYLGGQPYGSAGHYLGTGGGNAAGGYADFEFALPGLPEGHTRISFTATRLDLGATSEFGRCLPLVGSDQVAQADVAPGQSGTVLDGQGATITIASALTRPF